MAGYQQRKQINHTTWQERGPCFQVTSGKWAVSFSHQRAATFSAEGASLSPSAACKVGAMLGLALLPGVIREAGGSQLVMTPPEGMTLGYYIPCLSQSHH